MATGLKPFARGQLGVEATPGTAVAATRVLHFETFDVDGEYMMFAEPDEELNSLALVHRSTPIGIDPIGISISGELTFEEIVYWLQGALKGGVAPTQPDPAADLYTFAPSYTALNGLKTFTLEYGDNEQEYEYPYCCVQDISIDFAADAVATCDVSLVGQRKVASTFTGALAATAVNSAVGAKAQLYMDTTWAGIGGTQFESGALLDGSVTIRSGLQIAKRADGNLYFTKAVEGKRRIVEAEFTFEHDTASKALQALYEANTSRFFELRFVGPTITGAFDHFIKLQWSGPFRMYDYGDVDSGVKMLKVRSVSQYDITGTAEAKALVQNALNSVTEF